MPGRSATARRSRRRAALRALRQINYKIAAVGPPAEQEPAAQRALCTDYSANRLEWSLTCGRALGNDARAQPQRARMRTGAFVQC